MFVFIYSNLHIAVYNKNFELLEALLGRAEREGLLSQLLNSKNTSEVTPVFAAVRQGTVEMVRLLIKYGADVNIQSSRLKVANEQMVTSPLIYAAERGEAFFPKLEAILEAPDVNINIKNHKGNNFILL